ncbi:MAG TPA: hypothetical protein PKY73_12390, partial [Hyphomonas sp.]|nr:hypothetical protein [Hyphomonas sp.]
RADADVERLRTRAGETMAIRGKVAMLQADFPAAADFYQRAADTVAPADTVHRSLFLLARASVLGQAGQIEDDASAVRQALQLLNGDVSLLARDDQQFIAVVQTFVCDFERHLARWDGPSALHRAAAACNAVISADALAPEGTRASALMNYGNVLAAQGDWSRAAATYNSARLLNTSIGNEADAMAAAISYATATAEAGASNFDPSEIESAIRVLSQLINEMDDEHTADWAGGQINLGNAQLLLSDVTGQIQPLLDAQYSYLLAVNFFNHESTPASWAKANKNYALASERIATKAIATGRTQIAVQALQNVVQANENVMLVRTRERDPKGWEEAHSARIQALSILSELGTRP